MKKWAGIFLALAILALFSSGCAGVSGNNPGFTSDENYRFGNNPGYYQMHGY
jgi:hypothetical protein